MSDIEELKKINGIGDSTIQDFRKEGYKKLEDLKAISRSELKDIPGVGDVAANDILLFLDQKGLRKFGDEATKNMKKLQSLLKDLFQFDCADLDFGVYRIMNKKRDRIEDFIEEDLIKAVKEELEEFEDLKKEETQKEFERICGKIRDELGEDSLGRSNEIIEENLPNIPLANELREKHQRLKEKLEESKIKEKTEADIFNSLYNFFKRYYKDGDFVPQMRYSNEEKYAVPYNGEEVCLHWANKGQYYIKTSEKFKDYSFELKPYEVKLKIRNAELKKGNKKDDEDKYFLLYEENPVDYKEENKELIINFKYLPLTGETREEYGINKRDRYKQRKIRNKIKEEILSEVNKDLKERLAKEWKDNNKSVLNHHLYNYMKGYESSYFIHKDLNSFLKRELDFYIKNELFQVDGVTKEDYELKPITRAKIKVIKNIANKIIDFVGQIEDFQKRLWEKKKFVVNTDYVITLDRIKDYLENSFEEVLAKVLGNKDQIKEWKALGFLNKKEEINSFFKKTLEGKELKDKYKFLPIDTQHFDQDFKHCLIEGITKNSELDRELDGVLFKSENWQALNLLEKKYKGKIDSIYIDPPFNKEKEANYPYRSNYKDSTWISMLNDRINFSRKLMDKDSSIFVRCDYRGNMYVRMLMNNIFRERNFRNEIIVNKSIRIKTEGNKFLSWHDTIFMYSKDYERSYFNHITKKREEEEWRSVDMDGETWDIIPENMVDQFSEENIRYDEEGNPISRARIIQGKEILPPEGRRFPSQETINELEEQNKIRLSKNNNPQMKKPSQIYLTDDWTDIYGYASDWSFETENSEILLKRVINCSSKRGDIVMDYFLGSGTTTAVAHKLGRRWAGVEVGDQFYEFILPRMKNVLAYDDNGISDREDVKRDYNEDNAGGFFKYQKLEQYEDTLENIRFTNEPKQTQIEDFNEYFLRYMLNYETKNSNSLLNIEELSDPFSYRMFIYERDEKKRKTIDLVETFNYLIGLEIHKIQTFDDQNRKYRIVKGEKDGEKTIIIWRNTENLDMEEDSKFIEEEILEGDEGLIYINGDNLVEGAKLIEKKFKEEMVV